MEIVEMARFPNFDGGFGGRRESVGSYLGRNKQRGEYICRRVAYIIPSHPRERPAPLPTTAQEQSLSHSFNSVENSRRRPM